MSNSNKLPSSCKTDPMSGRFVPVGCKIDVNNTFENCMTCCNDQADVCDKWLPEAHNSCDSFCSRLRGPLPVTGANGRQVWKNNCKNIMLNPDSRNPEAPLRSCCEQNCLDESNNGNSNSIQQRQCVSECVSSSTTPFTRNGNGPQFEYGCTQNCSRGSPDIAAYRSRDECCMASECLNTDCPVGCSMSPYSGECVSSNSSNSNSSNRNSNNKMISNKKKSNSNSSTRNSNNKMTSNKKKSNSNLLFFVIILILLFLYVNSM